MIKEHLAFIGGGNMARSLIGGLIAQGLAAKQVIVSDPQEAQRAQLAQHFGVRVTADNAAAAAAQIVVLAVKPQDLRNVAQALAPALARTRPLIVSVAAGIRTGDLERWLGGLSVVRTMPNRPALNGCGVTGMYAGPNVTAVERELASRILSAVGKAIWVEQESLMDAVTAVSGSGPAYFFLLMEMLEAAGTELGLPPEVSRALAVETAYGSGRMAREGDDAPALLRQQVTSKGGTTEAALKVLESGQVRDVFREAVRAAARRSTELAEQLGRAD